MTTIERAGTGFPPALGLLDRGRIIAKAGFNRWLVPPAALCIHLCIGMAYGFSVFWLPLSRAVGIDKSVACPDLSIFEELFTTTCDWRVSSLGWMYTLFFVLLGSSAAIWGGWLERAGPRKAGIVAALCWCGGLVISAIGVITHQLWMLWGGSGVIGGIGLGLGYISPVSTLVKWFPDRRGMATGMAIMGFGGGAMIGSPLATMLMNHYATPTSPGVWETFITMGIIYFVFMMGGAFGYRLPPTGWKPHGWAPPASSNAMITTGNVDLKNAQKAQAALVGAAFVGLFSLFNIAGRFFWASLSDSLGRKMTYFTFFTLGFICYASAPTLATLGMLGLFAAAFCLIASMYGGGFATIPAYLADIFGTQYVGAIHGRLLTAWSTAGIVGPVIVNYMHDSRVAAGVPANQIYHPIFYVLAGLLVAGFIANLLIRPLDKKWFMSEEEVAALQAKLKRRVAAVTSTIGSGGFDIKALLAWAAVGIPLAWGIWITLEKALVLFR